MKQTFAGRVLGNVLGPEREQPAGDCSKNYSGAQFKEDEVSGKGVSAWSGLGNLVGRCHVEGNDMWEDNIN